MYKVNFAGCSGIGKTTLAKKLSEMYNVPFVSGSYSDLIPDTKAIPHSDMIQQDARVIFEQDVQLLNARKKLYSQYNTFISDRSYLDSAAYMIQKLSHRLPTCEIEDFIEKCRVLTLLQSEKVIFIPYTPEYFEKWDIEDNGKRILNKFYQAEITSIIQYILQYWGCVYVLSFTGNLVYRLLGEANDFVDILILEELDFDTRVKIVDRFINE